MSKNAVFGALLSFVAMVGAPSRAADVPLEPAGLPPVVVQSALEFQLTPYLWLASVNGTLTIDSVRRPGSSITADFAASFSEVLSALNGVPFMGAGEIRYDRFALAFDLIYTPLAQDFSTPRDLFFRGGEATLRQAVGQALALYRVYRDPAQSFEIGAGARYYDFRTTLTLNPGLLEGESGSRSFSWTDPIIAARYNLALSNQFGMSLYGDIGGFGAGSDLSWQLIGTLDYHVTPRIDLRIGYRHLHVERVEGRGEIDLNMTGPLFAATFRF